MEKEIFKDIVIDGVVYDNYQVSNLGRVKSLNYNRTGKERLRSPVKNNKGYFIVGLSKNGKQKWCLVHRLVATTFLDNPERKPEVNHIDENKENNRVENLEWIFHKDNINYGTHTERMVKTQSKPILQLSLDGELIREWVSINECGRNGFDKGHVSACCKGKLKTHKGYIWKYKE